MYRKNYSLIKKNDINLKISQTITILILKIYEVRKNHTNFLLSRRLTFWIETTASELLLSIYFPHYPLAKAREIDSKFLPSPYDIILKLRTYRWYKWLNKKNDLDEKKI